MRYVFIGPDEKHFDIKKSNKIKKLVGLLFDYEYSVKSAKERILEVILKPSTGFTTAVANGILDFRKNNPDKPIRVFLLTEFSTDFAELPEKSQELFKSLITGSVECIVYVDEGNKTGGKAAYSGVVSRGVPVYYYDPNVKVDKVFEKEYKYIEEITGEKINLYANFNGEAYSQDGVRKKANGLTYSYRINTTLPNNQKFSVEYSNFVTIYHARKARTMRLLEAMWQEVEPNHITLSELFEEYIATKGDTPALQVKYRQYFNAHVVGSGSDKNELSEYTPSDYQVLSNLIRRFSLQYKEDGRYMDSSQYDEEGNYIRKKSLSTQYRQGYYTMLSNLFDYAYLKGYISYQPLYLEDIEKK